MGQLSSRPKKATYAEYVHEQQPCVLLKYNTTMAENHPHQLDETPCGAGEIDEGRDEKKTTTSGRCKRAGNTTWFRLRRCIRVRRDHTRKLLMPGHPKRLPMEIGLTLMANKGPRVPQIIKLLDWQDDADHYIMVLERPIPCTNMLSFMKLQGGSLNERTARHVMQQVIHAANVCCERGVFHRDIKLENVLIKYHVNGGYHAKPATVWSLWILLFATVCGYYPSDNDLRMQQRQMVQTWPVTSASLQPDPEQRLRLEEMRLHDWFKPTENSDSFLKGRQLFSPVLIVGTTPVTTLPQEDLHEEHNLHRSRLAVEC
ncbi:Serine/threonine-protein kinase pim-2 [Anabarilius grahami]|uniref:non-specific serine/threonine protein kinase n=1 Tax=Anabarilius grahami TaxID=495550 RepID=A0A3N0YJQ4_ANAGA|nr:Serine/threonine-protein kinase pim-2 [Anabarilius grahami]